MSVAHERRILAPSAPIGVFDSGVGGLTVMREIMRMLPDESLIYVGDTARCPYGPKEPQEIAEYAQHIGSYLVSRGVKLVVIACNTATAHALSLLQSQLPVACIGVIEPGARAAALATVTGRVGVIGTQGTIASGLYVQHLLQLDSGLQIVAQATPTFVDMVEESFLLSSHEASQRITRRFMAEAPQYLAPIIDHHPDVLVMGCTHYPLLAPLLQQVCGEQMQLISSAHQTALQVQAVLEAKRLLAAPQRHHSNTHCPAYSVLDGAHDVKKAATVLCAQGDEKNIPETTARSIECITTGSNIEAFARAAHRILDTSTFSVRCVSVDEMVW